MSTALKLLPVAALLTLPDTAIRLALALADAADAEGRVTLAPPGAGESVAGLSRPTFYRAGVSLISTGLASKVGNDWTLSWLAGSAAETVESAAETVAVGTDRIAALEAEVASLSRRVNSISGIWAPEMATKVETLAFDVDRALKRAGSALSKAEEHDEELSILLRAHLDRDLKAETPPTKPATPTPPAPLPAVAATLPIPFPVEAEPQPKPLPKLDISAAVVAWESTKIRLINRDEGKAFTGHAILLQRDEVTKACAHVWAANRAIQVEIGGFTGAYDGLTYEQKQVVNDYLTDECAAAIVRCASAWTAPIKKIKPLAPVGIWERADGTLELSFPFGSEDFRSKIKGMGMRWASEAKQWVGRPSRELLVKTLDREFGHHGQPGVDFVNVRYTLDSRDVSDSSLVLFGAMVLERRGKTMPVIFNAAVSLVDGEFSRTGGSVKNPSISERGGQTILIRGVPRAEAEAYAASASYASNNIQIEEIAESPVSLARAQLGVRLGYQVPLAGSDHLVPGALLLTPEREIGDQIHWVLERKDSGDKAVLLTVRVNLPADSMRIALLAVETGDLAELRRYLSRKAVACPTRAEVDAMVAAIAER